MENKYNFWIGIKKSVKNSSILLIPFLVAVLADLPIEYAWIVTPLIYFLKNAYENRTRK